MLPREYRLNWWPELRQWMWMKVSVTSGTWFNLADNGCLSCLCRNGNRFGPCCVQDAAQATGHVQSVLVWTFKNRHLRISKMLKEPIIACLSSYTILTNMGDVLNNMKPIIHVWKFVHSGYNAYIIAVEKSGKGTWLEVDFSPSDTLSDFNRLITHTGLREMLWEETRAL